jgi:hypothetical protein
VRALNADAFDDPLERAWHQRTADGGMWNVQKIHLRTGEFYYRFVDAERTPAPRWCEGAWWVDGVNYRRIVALAERGEQSLGYAARLLLALPYSFRSGQSNAVNGVVRALLAEPLDALAGRGRLIEDRAARAQAMKWQPPADVMQLYVPRLAPLHGTLGVATVAFPIVECRRVESGFFH